MKLLEYKPGITLKSVSKEEERLDEYQEFMMVTNSYTRRTKADIITWMKKVVKTRRTNNKYLGMGGINYDKLQAIKGTCITGKKNNIQHIENKEDMAIDVFSFLGKLEVKENE
jgi:hypothetical protein